MEGQVTHILGIAPYDGMQMKIFSGPTTSIQGAWFASPYWGIGGRLACSNLRMEVNGRIQDDNLESASVYIGPYFSYPVSLRWQVGSKLLAGYEFYKSCETHLRTLPGRNGIAVGTGVLMNYLAMQNLGVRFSVDYDLAPGITRTAYQPLHKLTLGIEVCAAF